MYSGFGRIFILLLSNEDQKMPVINFSIRQSDIIEMVYYRKKIINNSKVLFYRCTFSDKTTLASNIYIANITNFQVFAKTLHFLLGVLHFHVSKCPVLH